MDVVVVDRRNHHLFQPLLYQVATTGLSTLPEILRDKALASLRRLGVTVRTDVAVTAIDPDTVTLATGERIDAGMVVWAAGVAASPLGATLGVPRDRVGRIVVETDLSLPGAPDVFVVGDLAHVEQDGRPVPGVAPAAMQEGAHAAANIRRLAEGQPTRAFAYHDRGNMATIGRASAIADFGRYRAAGLVGWLLWLFVHIMQLTGFRNRVVVLTEWAWAYVTRQRGIRLITGIPEPVRPGDGAPPPSSSPPG
jgi:NADH dehydrogenase